MHTRITGRAMCVHCQQQRLQACTPHQSVSEFYSTGGTRHNEETVSPSQEQASCLEVVDGLALLCQEALYEAAQQLMTVLL